MVRAMFRLKGLHLARVWVSFGAMFGRWVRYKERYQKMTGSGLGFVAV